jgi:hypothetical protein
MLISAAASDLSGSFFIENRLLEMLQEVEATFQEINAVQGER